MIEVTSLSKSYTQGNTTIPVLRNLNLHIKTGESVAIIGPSGSGKSTFLSLLSTLDVPDEGRITIDGVDITTLSEEDLSAFRNKKVSIVFQAFELIPFFTALENVRLPLSIRGEIHAEKKAQELLHAVGLMDKETRLPSELSGGEQQRVSIARALASGSDIIFADEPTGNLDQKTGEKVLDILLQTVKEHKKTFVIITHDHHIAKKMDTVYELRGGALERVHNLV